MAFLDPQERMWEGKSGKYFKLADVRTKVDTVSPFNKVCDLTMVDPYCHGTIFRFPLRKVSSSLSNQCYDMAKIQQLLQALREEGKLLLLFLRSIESIEVHEINIDGTVSLKFSVCISQDRERIRQIRGTFMQHIEQAYKQSRYNIKDCIPMSVDFHVELNREGSLTSHHWLVVSHVGSENQSVLQQAASQHVFPWVGMALELSNLAQVGKGRVFCFLPMPPDITSPFPVHINGTFGLNDDRRTIRWQGVERKNDPAAQWNNLIVSFLLPSCYKRLLMDCITLYHLAHTDIYQCWPNVAQINASDWKNFLQPFLNVFLRESVVWTENLESSGAWIRLNEANLVPKGTELTQLIHTVLTKCELKIVQAPENVHAGIQASGFNTNYLSHSVARAAMKRFPASYTTLDRNKKLKVLEYCLSDGQYGDLVGLQLIPLADNTFAQFWAHVRGARLMQTIYICSEQFPRHLFLNADSIVVSLDDQNLMRSIQKVGASRLTQLQTLDLNTVVQLIKQRSFPSEWQSKNTAEVISPNHKEWYTTFWQWVQPHSLSYFNNDMIIPLSTPGPQGGLRVTRLSTHSPILHLTNSDQCSAELMSFISKMPVHVSKTSMHPFLDHKELYSYVQRLNPEGLVNALVLGCCGKYNQLNSISLTESEAQHVSQYLGGLSSMMSEQQFSVLINLPIFTTVNKSGLYSIAKANECSWNSRAIILPDNCEISDENLPSNIVFLSSLIQQRSLINKLSLHMKAPTTIEFVLDTLFVMVKQGTFNPASKLDDIMVEILTLLPSWMRKWPKQMNTVTSALQTLPFLPTGAGRKSPSQLYDSGQPELVALFQGEQVFPLAPFDTDMLVQLRQCGLILSATINVLVGVVRTIGPPASSGNLQQVTPVRYNRAKAVIRYLSRFTPADVASFFQQVSNISWIPVQSNPPTMLNSAVDMYPQCIPWKGKPYVCHFVSLGSHVFVPTPATAEYPFILGSQVYVADCVLQVSKPDNILPNSSSYVPQVLAHFKEVIAHSVECEPTERLLHLIYDYLNANCSQIGVDTFKTFPPWIWLTFKKAFVSPSVVAMKPNPSFPQDLSPYVYTLNDRFGVQYQPLFVRCGVGLEVVSRQIASVLGMMSRMGTSMMTADKAWQIVMSILNWLTNNGEKPIKEFDDVKLYVPVESKEEYPVLKEISDDVVYNDNDFLEGVLARSGQEYSYTLINHRISSRMASCLGLAALSKHLDISEETFEDVGQCEPLTVRLRNILRDYKDGLTIIKELIQNADDAEATEINICYDARTHCEDQRSLFFPHMSETHGPALVVHNNAVFTDDDFQNITKLAGATKENKPLKIGKFGIGFCSVYHMTDVPSFVSREFLYIFDPMLKYLGDAVKNRSRPGKKLSFTHRILKHSKQMDPFRDLYDFNPSQEYKGTIFRLPFRKNPSEISRTVYDSDTVMELLGNLEKHSNEIILFLRHIKCITFSRFDNGSKCPTVLCKIEKRSLCTFPGTRTLMCNVTNANNVDTESSNTWLIATTEKQITAKYATSSVACSLKHCNGKYQVCSSEGGSFCFLPLAKTTGLPVHISSNFAVSNNRRGIWTDDGSQGVPALEAQWNVELMTSTIPEAYCLLLETLKEMHLKDQLSEYIYCALWPSTERLHEKNPWSKSVDCMYKIIALKELFYSSAISKWLTLGQSKFLSNNILSTSISQQETEKCVLFVVKQLCLPVVDLPFQYHVHLDLENVMITEANFVEIFFKSINSLSHMVDTRNAVLLKILELYTIEVGKTRQNNVSPFLKNYPCIPCTPDGTVLKKASEIIDPQSVFAKMYDNSEHMLPISMFDGNTLAKASMHALGLHKDSVPWKFIIQRATGIQYYLQIDRKKALQRVDWILQSIKKNIPSNPEGLSDESKSLATIPFLPVKSKPNEYPLQWCGEGHDLGCGKELVLSGAEVKEVTVQRNELLSGSQVKILKLKFKNESETLPDNVIDLLQIKREPLCNDVVAHFKCLTQLVEKGLLQSRIVQNMCRSIYGYFEIQIKDSQGHIPEEMETLKHTDCILVKDGFVSSEFVSQEWSLDGPYLFKVPNVLTTRKLFAEFAGIKQSFGLETVFKALQRMKDDFNGKPVPENCQYIISKMISVLTDSVKDKPACCVVLPDVNYTLHDACNLVYNDTPWCPYDKEQTIFVHENIPRHLAQKLGVKTVRSQRVERYASANEVHFLGAEFGQHEELTQRIQNIIRDYPFDETIIKELLQNADDAKAETMYFILDKRTHKTDRILSENWKELQGPALLVWNNSVFSERDLEGIQKLGLGSKRSDTEKIGQYGIGFNAVYHLTDCPSFISGGETLCILDPHCRYAPGANALKPGRRFDHLSTGFWSDFQDMRSAYLHTETQSFPVLMQANLRVGSLFRFPIRHCEELVSLSKIIPKHDEKERSSRPLRANSLQDLLNAWSPCVKKSMLFLNNINAITFCTVEQNGRFNILHHFETHISTDGRQKCDKLHERVRQFNSVTTNTSCTVNYELEVLETIGKKERPKERWLVQQGIGDSMNDEQEWQYIRQVKPRHGIAFPLSSVAEFKSLVFCFLPLPVESHLPVLINGHFILHSNRRELWASTNPDCPDQKSTWNKRLISAIASSYASLLTDGGKKVIQRCEGRTREQVEADIKMYYNIFPDIHSEKLKGLWKELAEDVYKILSDENAEILANVREMKTALLLPDDNELLCTLNVKWCRLKDDAKKSEQVHFFTTAMENTANSKLWTHMHWNVFEAIGMTLTSAPIRIMDHFRHAGSDIPMTTPVVVFDYYASFNAQVLPGSHPTFPCHLEDTKFKTIDNIKIFLKYLRVKKDGIYEYVKAPYGVPLLLTADGNIRMNDENGKVVVSEYSALFPCSLHRFLHPDLIDLDLSKDYFINETACSYNDIQDILSETLPNEIHQCRVENFQEIIDVSDLQSYWECFCSDPVFLHCLPEIIQTWALLPSSTDQLFSGKSELLPIVENYSHNVNHQDCYKNVVSTLHSMHIPFLLPWACEAYLSAKNLTCCPLLTNPSAVILCLQIFHKESCISFSPDDTGHLKCLFQYLSTINFKSEQRSKDAMKSLPVFQTIDGALVSIDNKTTFIFPTNICLSGHGKWFVKNDVIFLDEKGLWMTYYSCSDIDVRSIRPEEIYCQYIFPKFHLLLEEERYEQLLRIRDSTFKQCSFQVTQTLCTDPSAIRAANDFLHDLKALRCLGEGSATLKAINEHCDHTLNIFTLFKEFFCFLPERYSDRNDWLEFFRTNGLQTNISKQQFLTLCHHVADGHNSDVGAASTCLLHYLWKKTAYSGKERKWCDSTFLGEVGSIPFVCMETLQHLSWIKPICAPTKHIHQTSSSKTYFMTELNRSFVDVLFLVWTIKPLVSLPNHLRTDVIDLLGVKRKVQLDVIIQNIMCIAESHLSDASHFDRLSENCKPPPQAQSLIEVMSKIFSDVQVHHLALSKDKLCILHSIPCIPVHRVFGEGIEDKDISILVKPCQVVTNMKERNFYPFLHQLPFALYGFLELLECFGVKKEIDASHMRTVLEMAFQASKNEPLDVNTNKIVATAIKSLYNILQECKGVDQNSIQPLYLPDHLNRLCESTTLVYVDDPQYKGAIFNFPDAELSEVCINLDETPHTKFFNTLDFCSALPESVKPARLSLCTTMQIDSEPVENQCPLAIQLQTILRMHKVFKAISTIVKHCTRDEALSKKCYDSLVAKASNIKVTTVQRLRYDIIVTTSQKIIGSKTVKYAYDENNCKLYIEPSAQVTGTAHDSIVSRLSCSFMKEIESTLHKSMPEEHLKQLSKFLPMLLNVPNEEGVDEALNEVYSLEVDYDETELRSLDPRHGEAIPLNWHHRLDQDVHNIFTYLEWVGFEKEEGRIVFAQVIHRVSQDTDDPYKTKYVIRISQDDMSGIEVSALDLYKFLRGDKTPDIELSDSQEIVLRQVVENDDTSNTAATNHASAEQQLGLEEILKQLCAELGNIWRLPEDDRRKAVKRLYLKWHPDKNPDQVQLAEQVFKFLKRQVDRLEIGLPLEDPTTQNPSENTASSTRQRYSNFWQAYYNHWDETVHNHQRSWHNESRNRRRNRHRGYGGGGGGWSYNFWSQPTWHPTPNREEGCKWLQQAEADMEVLQILYNATDTTRSACSYVCFLAYEVVCKALKGGLYLKCGLSSQDRVQHSVVLLANTLEAEVRSCRGMLLVHANVVKDYEESTRFPHLCQGEGIPARYFGCEQASEARKSALAVLNAVKEFMTL